MTQAKEQTDQTLVQRAKKGDLDAMAEIYSRYSGVVYAMALGLLGGVSDTEDVVQETFIKAWRSIDRFRGTGSLKSWLISIGLNLSRDLHRRQKNVVLLEEVPAASTGGDVMAKTWLRRGLKALPAGYREVLTLHDVLGMKHGDIAALMGISEGTSKSQLHKARAGMRAYLRKQRQGNAVAADFRRRT